MVVVAVAYRPSHMLFHLMDGSAHTNVRAVKLRKKLQIKHSISLSNSIVLPGQPVPADA